MPAAATRHLLPIEKLQAGDVIKTTRRVVESVEVEEGGTVALRLRGVPHAARFYAGQRVLVLSRGVA